MAEGVGVSHPNDFKPVGWLQGVNRPTVAKEVFGAMATARRSPHLGDSDPTTLQKRSPAAPASANGANANVHVGCQEKLPMRVRARKREAFVHPIYERARRKIGAHIAEHAAEVAQARWRWRDAAIAAAPRGAPRDLVHEIAARLGNETGAAWPSQATLAARIGVSTRTVRTAVRALEALGLLKVTRVGLQGVCVYFAVLPIDQNAKSTMGSASAQSGSLLPLETGSPLPTNSSQSELQKKNLLIERVPEVALASSSSEDFSLLDSEEDTVLPNSIARASTVQRAEQRSQDARPRDLDPADPIIGANSSPSTPREAANSLERAVVNTLAPSSLLSAHGIDPMRTLKERIAVARLAKDAIGRERWVALALEVLAGDLRQSDVSATLRAAGLLDARAA